MGRRQVPIGSIYIRPDQAEALEELAKRGAVKAQVIREGIDAALAIHRDPTPDERYTESLRASKNAHVREMADLLREAQYRLRCAEEERDRYFNELSALRGAVRRIATDLAEEAEPGGL